MTRRTTDQMFGKVVRDMAAVERERKEMYERIDRDEAEAEARLDEPLTRREVLDAIESVKSRYSPHHHSTIIELLDRLQDDCHDPTGTR